MDDHKGAATAGTKRIARLGPGVSAAAPAAGVAPNRRPSPQQEKIS
ncbi:MAG: hypothetical protein L0J58_02430 [Micrococcaceae bacterium]|nr:hypothetical protein [Micrococcaceae bacterium]